MTVAHRDAGIALAIRKANAAAPSGQKDYFAFEEI
jgi:hypothetical protein